MAENSKIEWTHHTFNPWVGCTKISPACDHCYAEGWAKRSGMVQWGPHAERRRTSAANWHQPIKWNRQAEIQFNAWNRFKADHPDLTDAQLVEAGFVRPIRPRVFCASLADVFDNTVPPAWRSDLFALIQETPYLDWLLLTKRIGNAAEMMFLARGGHLPVLPNVWIGATICNQPEADRDITKLLAVPAAVRFISAEPLLGPVDVTPYLRPKFRSSDDPNWKYLHPPLDWIIVGGESGPNARPMHVEWCESLRDQCRAAEVPFFMKQIMNSKGRKVPMNLWPADLQIQEYPR